MTEANPSVDSLKIQSEETVSGVKKMKRYCFAVFLALTVSMSGCGSGNGSPSSATAVVSSVSRPNMSISVITDSSLWKDFKNGQSNVVMKSGLPGILESPRDTAATYKQVDSFLLHSAVCTKTVQKDNITHPFKENGGYIGPPVLTVSDKQHKAVINPAWYIGTPDAGHFVVHHVQDILEINLDGEKIYIQSRTFYDWMYNNKWKPSFQNYTVQRETGPLRR